MALLATERRLSFRLPTFTLAQLPLVLIPFYLVKFYSDTGGESILAPSLGLVVAFGFSFLPSQRTVLKYLVLSFSLIVLIGSLVTLLGILPPKNYTSFGSLNLGQFHPGLVPALASIYLLLGLAYQDKLWEKGLLVLASLSTFSVTAFLLLPIFLFGKKGLLYASLLIILFLVAGGDAALKVGPRALEELSRGISYEASLQTVSFGLAIAVVLRSLKFGVFTLYTLRMPGLWLDPLAYLFLARWEERNKKDARLDDD